MMALAANKKVVLGDEYDDALWNDLRSVLRQLEATKQGESRGIAGSQEIDSFDLLVAGRRVHVEAETYIGLSIKGPPDLVDKIVSMIKKRQA